MKILILHNKYSAPSGEEHALQAIASLLEENGHHVIWFLRSSKDILGVKEKFRAFFSGIHSPGAVKALRCCLKSNTVDAALVQNLYPLLSPSILLVLDEFHIPVVMRCPNYRLLCPNGLHLSHGNVCEHCLGGKEFWCVLKNCENNLFKSTGYALRNAAARISRRIMDNVSLFIVLSEFQKKRFMASGIQQYRIKIISNIAPAVHEKTSDNPGQTVSFVGRISPEKGIIDFMAAAARLPDIPFAVAGNHDEIPGLVNSSPGNVRWMGFLRGRDLDEFYHQSRILVVPGRCFEGFPNVITHGMNMKKPVIASRLGGVPEIVDHGKTGLLFEPGNVTALTAAIQELYADPALCTRMGEAGNRKAATVYSPKAVYEKWKETFEQVLK